MPQRLVLLLFPFRLCLCMPKARSSLFEEGRRFLKTQPSDVTALAKSAELEAVFTQALVLLPHRIPSSLKTSPLPTEVVFERSTMWRL